jgi:hypothetical protein
MMITNKKYSINNLAKLALIGFLAAVLLILPILTLLPDLSSFAEIQKDSTAVTIQQSMDGTFQIAVNWGSRPIVFPPPSIDSTGGAEDTEKDGDEVARVNWGSSPIVFPPPSPSTNSVSGDAGEGT